MKLMAVIISPSTIDRLSGGQVLKCLPTVVSLLCMHNVKDMSLEPG